MLKPVVAWADAHLVPEWRKAHHFLSVRAAALNAAVLVTWVSLPDDLKSALPHWLIPSISMFALVVGVGGALTNQKSLKGNADVQSTVDSNTRG